MERIVHIRLQHALTIDHDESDAAATVLDGWLHVDRDGRTEAIGHTSYHRHRYTYPNARPSSRRLTIYHDTGDGRTSYTEARTPAALRQSGADTKLTCT